MNDSLLHDNAGAPEAQPPRLSGSGSSLYNSVKSNLLALDHQYILRVAASATLHKLDYTGFVISAVGSLLSVGDASPGMVVSLLGFVYGVIYQSIALALQSRLQSGSTMSLYRYGVSLQTDRDYAFPSQEAPALHFPTPDCELEREKDLKTITERLKEENRLRSGDACFAVGKCLYETLMIVCCCSSASCCNTNSVEAQLRIVSLVERMYMSFTRHFGAAYQVMTYLPVFITLVDLAGSDRDEAIKFLLGLLFAIELFKVTGFIKFTTRAKAKETQVVLEEVYVIDRESRTLRKMSEKVHHAFSIYQYVTCSFWSLLLWLYDAPGDYKWQLDPHYMPTGLSPVDPILAAELGLADGCSCGGQLTVLPGLQREQLKD